MEMGILDNECYKSVQIAQTSYILALRDMARMDHISVACMLKISKEDAKRLSKTPIHLLEKGLHECPPVLMINGQDQIRGVSPLAALLDSLEISVASFHNTAAHINAFTSPINSAPVQQVETHLQTAS